MKKRRKSNSNENNKITPTVSEDTNNQQAQGNGTLGLMSILYHVVRLPLQYPKSFFISLLLITGGIITGLNRRSSSAEVSPCQGFELISGNPSTAKRIILAEYHNRRDETNQCIDELTNKKMGEHTVLVESAPSGLEVNCQDQSISNREGRKCIGWNDSEVLKESQLETKKDIYTSALKLIKEKYTKAGVTDKKFDKSFFGLANNFSEKLKEFSRKHNIDQKQYQDYLLKNFSNIEREYFTNLFFHEAFNDMKEMRKNGKSYQEIFNEKQQDLQGHDIRQEKFYDIHDENLANSLSQSNKRMTETLVKHSGVFTLVVTGKSHVVKPEVKSKLDESIEYVKNELEKDKDQNPYAILAMLP